MGGRIIAVAMLCIALAGCDSRPVVSTTQPSPATTQALKAPAVPFVGTFTMHYESGVLLGADVTYTVATRKIRCEVVETGAISRLPGAQQLRGQIVDLDRGEVIFYADGLTGRHKTRLPLEAYDQRLRQHSPPRNLDVPSPFDGLNVPALTVAELGDDILVHGLKAKRTRLITNTSMVDIDHTDQIVIDPAFWRRVEPSIPGQITGIPLAARVITSVEAPDPMLQKVWEHRYVQRGLRATTQAKETLASTSMSLTSWTDAAPADDAFALTGHYTDHETLAAFESATTPSGSGGFDFD